MNDPAVRPLFRPNIVFLPEAAQPISAARAAHDAHYGFTHPSLSFDDAGPQELLHWSRVAQAVRDADGLHARMEKLAAWAEKDDTLGGWPPPFGAEEVRRVLTGETPPEQSQQRPDVQNL